MKNKSVYGESYFASKNTFFYQFGYQNTIKIFPYFKKTVKEIEYYIRTKNTKILDVGCATGDILNLFNKKFRKYGIDISEYAIKVGKKNFPKINLKVADVEKKLPFKDNFFDIVIAMDIIEHIKKQKSLIKDIFNIMKKGGLLFITTPNNNLLRKTVYKYMDKLSIWTNVSITLVFLRLNR